ncbi:MAG: HRDC domain-containing protein [Cyanobium sp.]
MASRSPASRGELSGISGVGQAKLERYGEAVLAVLAEEG